MTNWAFLLSEFEITYMNQKVVKGLIIADYLVGNPILKDWGKDFEFPNEDIMSIDVKDEWKI